MRLNLKNLLFWLVLPLLLAACQAVETDVSAPPTAATAATAPTNPPPSPTTAVPTAAAAAALSNELPAGVTAEGAYYLGDPNAPVAINDYSNFL